MAIGASQGNVIASAFVRIQPETSGFGPALRQTLATNLLQLEKQQEGFFNKIKGSVATTAKLFATAGATSLSLFGAAAFASAKDLEKTSNAFKGLYGSVAEGKKQFDAVFKLAEQTPFEGSGLSKDFQKFVAAYSSAGMPIQDASKKTLGILQSLADSGSALGATSENIDGFALALTQTIGKGKLTGEEIRQMTNNLAGFNVRAAVATKLYGNSLPESVAKLDKAMKKGEVTADVAIDGILEGLNKIPGAAGASARQLRTVSGALSTVKDIFERSTFEGLEQPLKVLANTLVDNSEVFRNVFRTMSSELGGIVVTFSGLMSEVMGTFDESFGKLAIGGLRAAGGALYGFQDGLKESLSYLGVLGQMMQDNQGYFVILGRSLGTISAGFSALFTHIVKGFEPMFKTGVMVFDMFAEGFKNVTDIFGPQLERGLLDVGMSIMQLFNALKKSFSTMFDSEVANNFIRTLASVGRSLFELVISPLDALSKKTDGIASGFEKMFKTWTPPLEDFKAAILGLADSFGDLISGVDMNVISDFVAGTGKHLIEAFTALSTYGSIFIGVLESMMGILGPLNALFGNFAEQAGAAFLVFKLTNSPILTLIALFKDLDTGLVVFFLTLSKVVPMIRQMQTAFASLKVSEFAGNLATMGLGLQKVVGSVSAFSRVAPQSMGQFVTHLGKIGEISPAVATNLNTALASKGLIDLPARSAVAQGQVSKLFSTIAIGSKMLPRLEANFRTLGPAIGGSFSTAEKSMRSVTASGNAATKNLSQFFSMIRGNNVAAPLEKGAVAANSLATNTKGAVAPAASLGSALGGIAGIAGSIGLGVGISLLTSALASSAEKANQTKKEIAELADLSFNYLNAKTGVDRSQAITEGVTGIQQRFGEDSKALGEFNSLLYRNGLSTEQFYRNINKDEKTRTKTVGKLVGDLLTQTAKKEKGNIFESSQGVGPRGISKKTNQQALDFYKDLAKIDGAELERGLNIGDKGVKELIAKRVGITEKAFTKASKDQKQKYLKDAKVNELFGTDMYGNLKDNAGTFGDFGVQLKGKYKEVAVVLGQISKAAGDGAYKQEQMNKALMDSDTIAKNAAESYKLFGESQKIALTSSSAFFDKIFEYNNPENIKKLQGTVQAARAATFDINKLMQTQGGRDFLTPFSGLVEAEAAIKTNINAPVVQTIGLLKQSNEEFIKLGKAAGLSVEEIAKVQVGIGDLSFAEDFGDLVNGLSDAGKVGGANLKAILAEAIKLSPPEQKAFLDSIVNNDTRKTIEKGLKDLKGSVILEIDPSVFSNLSTAIASSGKKSKDLDLEFLNGAGIRSIGVRNAISDLFAASIPIVQKLNEEYNKGEIDAVKYATSVRQSRTELIQTLVDEGVSLKNAQKIYRELGLVQETTQIKALINGKPPEEATAIIKAYLDGFTKDEWTLKIKAEYELDPVAAGKDFTKKIMESNPNDKKKAAAGLDPTAVAKMALSDPTFGKSGYYQVMQVMPEIPKENWAAFFAAVKSENNSVALEMIPFMDKNQLNTVIKEMPTEQAVSLFTEMDPSALAATLALIPASEITRILPEMDQVKLAGAIALMPKNQATNILLNLPPEESTAIIAEISKINPELATTLRITGITGKTKIIVDGQGNITGYNAGAGVQFKADGDILTTATHIIAGEAGAEAIIPMTRPKRALQLLKQSGLYDLALTHAKSGNSSNAVPYSTGTSTDRSITNNIKVEMNNTRTTDPEGMALLLASRLTNGIRR